MIDGTYEVEAKTPLGRKAGTIVLTTDGDVCHAELTVAGKTANLDGTIEDGVVTFEGSVKMPFPLGKTNYQLVGSVDGDELTATCTAKKFNFDVSGKRVS